MVAQPQHRQTKAGFVSRPRAAMRRLEAASLPVKVAPLEQGEEGSPEGPHTHEEEHARSLYPGKMKCQIVHSSILSN